jgi:MSHA biogenesis protein MshG
MAKFSYTGRLRNGDLTTGSIDANDEIAAAKVLAGRNITPIEILAGGEVKTGEKVQKINFLTPRVKLDDLVIFARQMYSLTRAGIPILRSVAGLADTTTSLRMKYALEDVMDQLERGRNLSSAMNQHPQVFSQLFIIVVHVGENTGQLDLAFLQLAEYLEREQETRKQIKQATRYPTFVIIALALALVIMNIWVIPIFAGMFARFDAELPAMTLFLMGMSEFFLTQWQYLVIGLILIIYAVRRYVNTDSGRYRWDKFKLRIPVVGAILERSLLGRFARSFAMMLKSGVPLTTALNLVAEAVSNAYMADKIIEMRRSIERGENLTRVANSSGLFTPLVMQMISVGEETGRVDELLGETASYYEREVDYDLKSMTSKIEPILIVVVAAMVLVLALGIFTPMWDMMGAIRGGN